MPRATFGGVIFDLLLRGFENPLRSRTTIRYAGAVVYLDIGGAELETLTGEAKFDSLTDYTTFKNLVGTPSSVGTLVYAEGSRTALLQSVSRNWRKGSVVQIARTEWTFLS